MIGSTAKRLRGVIVALLTAKLVRSTLAVENFTSIADAFPLLSSQDLLLRPKSGPGRQNLTYCCLLAMNTSLTVENGTVVRVPSSGATFAVDPSLLPNSQFPCGATYDGNRSGAPDVFTTLRWCRLNCPGWERSDTGKLNQWAQPLVGFILPALVFCLTVPRRRKLNAIDAFFNMDLNSTSDLPKVFYAIFAALFVSVDTIIWLGTMFAMSGPILFSGMFEAALDRRVLKFVQDSMRYDQGKGVPLMNYALLLFGVLAGNLDIDPAYKSAKELAKAARENDDESRDERESRIMVLQQKLAALLESQYSFGTVVGAPVVFYTGSFIYSIFDVLSNRGNNDTANALAFGMWWMICPFIAIVSGCLLAANNPSTFLGIAAGTEGCGTAAMETRTHSHTGSLREWWRARPWVNRKQLNTGTSGIDSSESRGQPGNRERLSTSAQGDGGGVFSENGLGRLGSGGGGGIVSAPQPPIELTSRPLRGSGDVGGGISPQHSGVQPVARPQSSGAEISSKPSHTVADHLRQGWYRLIHPTSTWNPFPVVHAEDYRPAWIWDRGKRKQQWIEKIIKETSSVKIDTTSLPTITVLTLMLMLIPCLLGGVTAYFTPKVGLGCRSFTMLIYFSSQSLLTLLWMIRFCTEHRTPTRRFLWWAAFVLIASFAVFSAVGGTLMQLIGVYRNCICSVSVWEWHNGNSLLRLSTNNKIHIDSATRFWQRTGGVATGFLAFLAYIGWWYQRNLRHNCLVHIRELLNEHERRYPKPATNANPGS